MKSTEFERGENHKQMRDCLSAETVVCKRGRIIKLEIEALRKELMALMPSYSNIQNHTTNDICPSTYRAIKHEYLLRRAHDARTQPH